ncbi:MAG: circularly permuted type 2 ATP-grasp protein [Limisphaerales bacterium]
MDSTSPVDESTALPGPAPAALPPGFDEQSLADGSLRPAWQSLWSSLEGMGAEELLSRVAGARRILRDHGASYDASGDDLVLERPWELDIVPMVLAAAEWRALAEGLKQRTRLLNLVLSDLYGPRETVRHGWLPPGWLYANPNFLRPCHGLPPAGGRHLNVHAVDLARSPAGTWWVVADRTQAPLGLGYVLENRVVSRRVLPDLFRECGVETLASSFEAFGHGLRALSPRGETSAHVVLLSGGPRSESYFEDVYLARYLGFPLVEGPDLTVRRRRVFIKTLEGLQRVDVILRRVEERLCDPLELAGDSFLGVPGLLDALRAGTVAVANAPGAGLVECPALLPFLPGLCRGLLEEELALPSVATWWCGQSVERDHVLGQIDELNLLSAFPAASEETVFGDAASTWTRTAMLARLRSAPHTVVGQERLIHSTIPVWTPDGVERRPLVLRAFIVVDGDQVEVLPGGLIRTAAAADERAVSMHSGGIGKDLWILADGPATGQALAGLPQPIVRLDRAAAEVPSRVADNLFWMGRYAERLEDTVRILRCFLARLVGEAGFEETPGLRPLVHLLVRLDLMSPGHLERVASAALEREALVLIFHAHRLGTVREVLDRLRHIAFIVRDRFSSDIWRILNRLQADARPRQGRVRPADALALLNGLVMDLAALSGLEMENMTRGHGWRFLELGRRLERAVNVITLAQAGLAIEREGLTVAQPMLEIADSVMTYRRRYFAAPQLPAVLDLLISEPSNPRSLAFQIAALAEHVARLPVGTVSAAEMDEADLINRAAERIARFNMDGLYDDPEWVGAEALKKLLEDTADALRHFSEAVTHRYFNHARLRLS